MQPVCSVDHGLLLARLVKDMDAIMAAQTDLVEVLHPLKQVICVKG
ncbi:hypothetical protein KV708_16430 [Comamonas thiooxydans]|nr:hypothetical protein [Comamonas thiooxydans]